jgi:hypothetical protein
MEARIGAQGGGGTAPNNLATSSLGVLEKRRICAACCDSREGIRGCHGNLSGWSAERSAEGSVERSRVESAVGKKKRTKRKAFKE